ncbi:hypothetical protein Cni_G03246 [Canna indica]|uniref:Rhodanese domain-containing protein n=1 Tax=Canna indica TaxID=4628 RepID=A0AAQ3JR99_9LILI|nr:hypothetical protein Cni_G03246 [Canna indica]
MLSLCSAAATFSSYAQASLHAGAKAFYPLQKVIDDRLLFDVNGKSYRRHATKYMHSLVVERPQGSLDTSILSPYPDESDDIVRGFQNEYFENLPESSSYSKGEIYGLYPVAEDLPEPEILPSELGVDDANDLINSNVTVMLQESAYAELPSATSSNGDEFPNISESLNQSSNALLDANSDSSILSSDATASTQVVSDTFDVNNKGFSDVKENVENFITGINQSVDASFGRAEDVIQSTLKAIKMTASNSVESLTKSIDSVMSNMLSSVYNSKEQATNELTGFSTKLKENAYGASSGAIDILRQAIIVVEDSLGNATSFLVYSYGSAKSLLPPNIKEALNFSEEKASQIVEPVGAVFQKAYVIIEGFERNLGLDPTDPVVQFLLLLGSSAAIGTSYWFYTYGGYSGSLTPETTFELLKDRQDAVLIDVRPEDLREKDGLPDLRRGARSRYASVNLPEIDGSVRKLLKGGRDVDYSLIAAVIRNLKIIKSNSKVIVMDANGSYSKAIARSLKKLGVQSPYMVQGGFQSWVKNGLRVKELKPETTLTLLNEEAEAIIADIKPTPTFVIGSVLGISAATYAFLEWEKTLQVIGIIGLGQSLYQRFASYEDSEDLKKDISLLLSPVKLGARAFSWATARLEQNKLGLPTSPSSTAVRDRVVQAAAKHQSQPSVTEELQGLPQESLVQTNENQVSEA